MAAPHVAGAAALYLEHAPNASPAEVAAALLHAASPGVVQNGGPGSPNLLLYTGSDTNPSPTYTPAATPTATPAGPTATPVATRPVPTPTPTPTATPLPPGALSVAAIGPNAGYNDAPNEVTITGTNFRAGVAGSIGTAPLGGVELVGATELHAVVPGGMAPGVYTLRLRNSGDPEPARLPDSYTVLAAGSEDFWATAEDLWTDPLTVRQGQAVQLGLNVHRHGGSAELFAGLFAGRTVEVCFYRQLAPAGLPAGGPEQLLEIGCTTTSPFTGTGDSVQAVAVAWDTAGLPITTTIVAIVDPANKLGEAVKSNNRVARTLTLQPSAGGGAAPILTGLAVNAGAEETTSPVITLTLTLHDAGSATAAAMYLVEREYVLSARRWVAVQNSGWLPFTPAHVMTLTEHGGLRYLQAWVSDGAGNISLAAATASINYNPPAGSVPGGQVRLYRRALTAGQRLSVTLQPTAGDADLYVWAPDGSLAGYSNGNGLAVDSVNVTAPADGDYQIEVFGYVDAVYALAVAVDDAAAPGTLAPANIAPNKVARSQPFVPQGSAPSEQVALPPPPGADTMPILFLPQVGKE